MSTSGNAITAYPLAWPAGWPNLGDKYEVGEDGHVYRMASGKRMPEHADEDGYLCVLVRIGVDKRRNLRVHRAVCEAFHGPRPSPAHLVRHVDGDKTNNRPSNVKWGTHAENEADAVRLGEKATGHRNGAYTRPEKRRRGESNGNGKLNAPDVLAILADERAQEEIATAHGVSQSLVSQIKRGRIWNHVTGLPLTRANKHPELNAARDEALREVGHG